MAAAKSMLESSTGLIQTARSLAVNPKDPPKWSVLAGHSRTVSDSIKKLITNMRYGTSDRGRLQLQYSLSNPVMMGHRILLTLLLSIRASVEIIHSNFPSLITLEM